ncbi:hypothetical protein [Actinophytocola glycyrrhizae]|uniref:Uncharacterized protein n=1 Tax=Actinophytocola glycyrrhizae TaxID=2044873 RepID=A0ABV9SBK4_9PSEU
MTTEHDRSPAYGAWPTAVAIEVLLLWPRGVAGHPPTVEEAGLWPVFAMVVTEPADQEVGSARPLFGLLDRPRGDDEMTVVAADAAWSILDEGNALLGLTVRGTAPVRFGMRVLLPSARVLGVLDVVARGATIGITTRDRAARLRDRVDIRTALRDLVLLSCPPSVELAALAHTLLAARDGEHSA